MVEIEELKNNSTSDVVDKNRQFYGDLYRGKNFWRHLVHMLISFDQQSKAKLNHRMLLPYISELKMNGQTNISVLDYGSGWGSLLKKLPKSLSLYCYDLSEVAMLKVCKTLGRLGYHIKPIDDFDNKDVLPVKFDFIVCSHVLEHVEDDFKLLKEFHQALASNGRLMINVPINEVWKDPKHVREYSNQQLQSLLKKAGFNVVEFRELDKWTGYLLEKEFVSVQRMPRTWRIFLKALRLVLAITPCAVVRLSERLFFSKRKNQQLLTIAEKSLH